MSEIQESLEWRSVVNAAQAVDVRASLSTLEQSGIIAYTDGACIKNPGGPAGWGAILLPVDDVIDAEEREGAQRIECSGHIPQSSSTTNNRAEITAVLAVLCIAPPDAPLKILSDSEYTIKVAQGIYQVKANPDLWGLYRKLVHHRESPRSLGRYLGTRGQQPRAPYPVSRPYPYW